MIAAPHDKEVRRVVRSAGAIPTARRRGVVWRLDVRTMGRTIGALLFAWLSITSNPSKAAGFQTYFANMRQCLSSDNVEDCLPERIDENIGKPAEDYTREQFVNLVISDPGFRDRVSSCFALSARIVLAYADTKLFRSADHACEVRKINGAWRLTGFYDFSSNE